jgi:adenine phosphoribosyltransferase
LATELNCAFVPIRKSGKLPFRTLSQDYALEYGSASVEMHEDAVKAGWRVMVHDDLLATGGTAGAAASLVNSLGANVAGFSFLIELTFLYGRKSLKNKFGVDPYSLVSY